MKRRSGARTSSRIASKAIDGVVLDRHRVSAGRRGDLDAGRIHVGVNVRIADHDDQRRDRRDAETQQSRILCELRGLCV